MDPKRTRSEEYLRRRVARLNEGNIHAHILALLSAAGDEQALSLEKYREQKLDVLLELARSGPVVASAVKNHERIGNGFQYARHVLRQSRSNPPKLP